MSKFDYVIYHSPCVDGNTAAWSISYLSNKLLHHSNIVYIPCKAGEDVANLHELVAGKNVCFVDYSPSVAQIYTLQNIAQYILIIDHHEKTINNIITNKFNENVELFLNIAGCGASLVWKYFEQTLSIVLTIPEFIKYVEARDTWNFKLLNSEIICLGLYADENISDWCYLNHLADENSFEYIDMCYNDGIKLMEYKNKCVDDAIQHNKIKCMYKNYNIWLYTCNNTITSDVGNKLMEVAFPDGTYPDFTLRYEYDIINNAFKFSARSKNEKVNVNLIANEFGGGGHRNASGFIINNSLMQPLNNIFIQCS